MSGLDELFDVLDNENVKDPIPEKETKKPAKKAAKKTTKKSAKAKKIAKKTVKKAIKTKAGKKQGEKVLGADVNTILKALNKLASVSDSGNINHGDLLDWLAKNNISYEEGFVEDVLFELAQEGMIYQPRPEFYSLMDDTDVDDEAELKDDDKTEESTKESDDDELDLDDILDFEDEKDDSADLESETEDEDDATDLNEDLEEEEDELGLNSLLETEQAKEDGQKTTSTALQKLDTSFVSTIDNIPKQFVIDIKGTPYISKAGLLFIGKKVGVVSIKTKAILNTWENDKKVAKYKAIVKKSNGEEYDSDGIAIPDGKNIKNKWIWPFADLLAETRAINRALRLATNCGFVSAEELSDYTSPDLQGK